MSVVDRRVPRRRVVVAVAVLPGKTATVCPCVETGKVAVISGPRFTVE